MLWLLEIYQRLKKKGFSEYSLNEVTARCALYYTNQPDMYKTDQIIGLQM
jgi:hypothetical protein